MYAIKGRQCNVFTNSELTRAKCVRSFQLEGASSSKILVVTMHIHTVQNVLLYSVIILLTMHCDATILLKSCVFAVLDQDSEKARLFEVVINHTYLVPLQTELSRAATLHTTATDVGREWFFYPSKCNIIHITLRQRTIRSSWTGGVWILTLYSFIRPASCRFPGAHCSARWRDERHLAGCCMFGNYYVLHWHRSR